MQQEVLAVLKSQDPHEDPHGTKTIQVRAWRQAVQCRIYNKAMSPGKKYFVVWQITLRKIDICHQFGFLKKYVYKIIIEQSKASQESREHVGVTRA